MVYLSRLMPSGLGSKLYSYSLNKVAELLLISDSTSSDKKYKDLLELHSSINTYPKDSYLAALTLFENNNFSKSFEILESVRNKFYAVKLLVEMIEFSIDQNDFSVLPLLLRKVASYSPYLKENLIENGNWSGYKKLEIIDEPSGTLSDERDYYISSIIIKNDEVLSSAFDILSTRLADHEMLELLNLFRQTDPFYFRRSVYVHCANILLPLSIAGESEQLSKYLRLIDNPALTLFGKLITLEGAVLSQQYDSMKTYFVDVIFYMYSSGYHKKLDYELMSTVYLHNPEKLGVKMISSSAWNEGLDGRRVGWGGNFCEFFHEFLCQNSDILNELFGLNKNQELIFFCMGK